MRLSPSEPSLPPCRRAWTMTATLILHLTCYFSVNRINALVPPSMLRDLSLPADAWIPYVGWTAAFYYFGVPFMSIWAFFVVWRLPAEAFRPAIRAYVGMILIGAATQLVFPARSPWPSIPVPFQHFMHMRVSYDPFVCFPSMHVALSVLPACLTSRSFHSRAVQAAVLLAALMISLSTLTLKEHYLVDTVSGAVLALAAYASVLRQLRSAPRRSKSL